MSIDKAVEQDSDDNSEKERTAKSLPNFEQFPRETQQSYWSQGSKKSKHLEWVLVSQFIYVLLIIIIVHHSYYYCEIMESTNGKRHDKHVAKRQACCAISHSMEIITITIIIFYNNNKNSKQ